MSNAIALQGVDLVFQTEESLYIDTKHFLEKFKEINKLPFSQGDFYFSDDVWDFSPYQKIKIRGSTLKFNFKKVCDCFKDELKFFVLFKMLENKLKIQTIQHSFRILALFLNEAYSANCFKVEDISGGFIAQYLEILEEKALSYQLVQKNAIKTFYEYYSVNFKNLLVGDIGDLLKNIDYRYAEAERKHNKVENIPQEYFNNFLAATIKIMDDTSVDESIRATAALYLILSQTGLRIGECMALEVDCMESVSIFNGETAYYLKYKTWKRESGNNTFSWATTYVNELTKKGYDFLTEIYRDKRTRDNTTFLFLGPMKNKTFPIHISAIIRLKHRLFVEMNNYFPTVNLPDDTYKNITNVKVAYFASKEPPIYIAEPTNHQFRVHMCTELYNKGVPLKYIEKFMSHLSHEMADYYVRPTKQNPQENMDFSLDTLKKIVTGETKLLGGNGGLQAKINEFIEQNHYNVETDLQAICEKLAENIPIRQKTGGVCIKSSMLRECSKDSKTNEFYCAYGVCPNIFHFYYMADVSYRQAKELSETIEINKGRGLLRQVEKESNMLHNVVKNKLIPELDELKNVINKKGYEAVIVEYPDLKDIIENLDSIYKEAEAWLK